MRSQDSLSYGFSTCWNVRRTKDLRVVFAEIGELGFEAVELNGLSRQQVDQLLKIPSVPRIISIHNPCPRPEEELDRPVFNDHYFQEHINLMAREDPVRERAIRLTRETIDLASTLGAGVVILHLGWVEVGYVPGQLRRWIIEYGLGSEAYFERLFPLLEKRKGRVEELWPTLLEVLDHLNRYALAKGVKLALENRSIFLQVPNLSELKAILERFGDQSAFYYWHDIGHAQLQDHFLIQSQEELLQELKPWLLGLHIHDARISSPNPIQEMDIMRLGQEEYVGLLESGRLPPLVKDHLAPATGDVDYASIGKYLGPEQLRILELRPSVERVDIIRAREFLKEINF